LNYFANGHKNGTRNVAIAFYCNLKPLDDAPVILSSNWDARARINLSVAVLQPFYCWYVTLCCDLDLWPLNLNIYRLWRGQPLY